MTHSNGAKKRKQALRQRLGSDEAVSEYFRAMQRKSMETPNKQKGRHKGGFNYASQERLQELSKMGVEARKKRVDG